MFGKDVIPKCGIVSTITVFAFTLSYYNRDGKDNHTINHFYLALGIRDVYIFDIFFN
jgi:hypothetical protein